MRWAFFSKTTFFLTVVLNIGPLPALADEVRPDAYVVGVSHQSSERYSGHIAQIGLETSPQEKWRLGLVAQRLFREYAPSAQIIDTSFAVGAAHSFEGDYYFESKGEFCADAEILPNWTVGLTPHKVIGSTDLGLGLDYRSYATVKAGSLHPSLRQEFGESFAISFGSFVARSDSTLVSYHGDVIFKPAARNTIRASAAGGRTLEDAGLSATFSSAFVGYSVDIQRFTLGIDGTRYWSEYRTETSIGARIEFK